MTPTFYTITAQTNLHVGSGDANYGIIDKLVQRDALTQFPVIHASSLKGAILQHFFKVLENNNSNSTDQSKITADDITYAFGSQQEKRWKTNKPGTMETSTGNFVFMQANLLSIPVRCKEHIFMRVSSSRILLDLSEQLSAVGGNTEIIAFLKVLAQNSKDNNLVLEKNYEGAVILEDKPITAALCTSEKQEFSMVKNLLGDDRVIILKDDDFAKLVSDHYLPVIARNHLENGQSTNLWYEQILPRQTRFGFTVLKPENHTQATSFDSILTDNGMVQIGANASVGYGFCKIDSATL